MHIWFNNEVVLYVIVPLAPVRRVCDKIWHCVNQKSLHGRYRCENCVRISEQTFLFFMSQFQVVLIPAQRQ